MLASLAVSRLCLMMWGMALLIQSATQPSPAPGNDRAVRPFRATSVFVDKDCIHFAIEILSLSDAQQDELRRLHREYWSKLEVDDAAAWERVLDAGLRESRQMSEDRRKGGEIDEAHKRELMLLYQTEAAKSSEELNGRAVQLIQEIRPSLSEEQAARLPRVERMMRRNALLQRSQPQGALPSSFNSRLDPIVHLDQLMQSDEAFAGIFKDQQVAAQLDATRERFEAEMDAVLVREISARHTPPTPRDIEDTKRVSEEISRLTTARVRAIQEFVTGVSALCAAPGLEACQQLWHNRMSRELWPSIHVEKWPDGMSAWLSSRPDATPEQVQQASALSQEWAAQLAALRWSAVKARTSAMANGIAYVSDECPPASIEVARRLERIEQRIEETIILFKALLQGQQLIDLDEALVEDRRGNPLLFKEEIPSVLRAALHGKPMEPAIGSRGPP